MARAFTNNTPDDVLETFRRIMSGDKPSASSDAISGPAGVQRSADILHVPTPVSEDETERAVSAVSSDAGSTVPEVAAPDRDSGVFVDRLATRMAFPNSTDAGPIFRDASEPPRPMDRGDAPRAAPMILTCAMAAPTDPCGEPRPAEEPADRKLCKLLLTPDFQVRGPERARVPHPAAPLSRDDYVEDSDLSVDGNRVADLTPAAAALRETVSHAVRTALRAEVGAIMAPAEPKQPDGSEGPSLETTLIDGEGYIDAEMLRRLVASIVRDELRGALGDEMSRRIRKLVRIEINRMSQVRALD